MRVDGEHSHIKTPESSVPSDADLPSLNSALLRLWGVAQTDDEIPAHRIGMEHLAPEDPLPFDHGPEFDFADVFEYNDPFRNRPFPEEEEAHADRDFRNSQANSRTPLIPKNQIPEPETDGSPAAIMGNYYRKIESRMGYRFILGGRRHFGYYRKDTSWPFPIKKALRAMEDCLMNSLDIPPGEALVLDAGCGNGYVAMHLAWHGQMRVHCIDVVARHVLKTQRNVARRRLEESVTAAKMDYCNLSEIGKNTFDAVFAMETLCHAEDPKRGFTEFLRVLKLKGTLVLHELVQSDTVDCPESFEASSKVFLSLNHVTILGESVLKEIVEKQGFENVVVEDISAHIMPMLRLFFAMAFVPSSFLRLFRLHRFFVDQASATASAMILYRGIKMGYWKYIVVKGKKPDIIVHRSAPISIPKRIPSHPEAWPFTPSRPFLNQRGFPDDWHVH